MKTVANKSKLKVAIVQAIDRKVALDDLAESRGIDFDELLTEVEAIVYSGTKINIDYFLDEEMCIRDRRGPFPELVAQQAGDRGGEKRCAIGANEDALRGTRVAHQELQRGVPAKYRHLLLRRRRGALHLRVGA